jgi:hypothetical protein
MARGSSHCESAWVTVHAVHLGSASHDVAHHAALESPAPVVDVYGGTDHFNPSALVITPRGRKPVPPVHDEEYRERSSPQDRILSTLFNSLAEPSDAYHLMLTFHVKRFFHAQLQRSKNKCPTGIVQLQSVPNFRF